MKVIQKWINRIGKEEMRSSGLEGLFATLASYLPKDITSTLSVGCGSGLEMDFLPGKVTGLEINPANGSDPRIKIGDMHEIPYPDSNFDLVYARDSFEHAAAPIAVLDEMTRVSKKYVVIVLPDDVWIESDWHLIIPTERQLLHLAELVGLKFLYRRDIRTILPARFMLENYLFLFEKGEKK